MCLQVCWGARGSRSAASWCTSAGSCPAPVDSAPPPVDPSDTERLWRSTSSHLDIQTEGKLVTKNSSNKIRWLISDIVLNLNHGCSGSPRHVFMNYHFLMMTGHWSKNRESVCMWAPLLPNIWLACCSSLFTFLWKSRHGATVCLYETEKHCCWRKWVLFCTMTDHFWEDIHVEMKHLLLFNCVLILDIY